MLWIWQTGKWYLLNSDAHTIANTDADADAKSVQHTDATSLQVELVKHIHWLHSRALKDQWHEELILVTHEMQWTVCYFLYKAKNWQLAMESQLISSGGKSMPIGKWFYG